MKRTDTDRLNFLTENNLNVVHRCVVGTQTVKGYEEEADVEWWEVRTPHQHFASDSLRGAIDTAMDAFLADAE